VRATRFAVGLLLLALDCVLASPSLFQEEDASALPGTAVPPWVQYHSTRAAHATAQAGVSQPHAQNGYTVQDKPLLLDATVPNPGHDPEHSHALGTYPPASEGVGSVRGRTRRSAFRSFRV